MVQLEGERIEDSLPVVLCTPDRVKSSAAPRPRQAVVVITAERIP
jgi:hypothetical protein